MGSHFVLKGIARNTTYYKESVNLLVSLAPLFSVSSDSNNNKIGTAAYVLKHYVMKYFGKASGYQNYIFTKSYGKYLSFWCRHSQFFCDLGIKENTDLDTSNIDHDRVPVFFGHYPSGTSTFTWLFV